MLLPHTLLVGLTLLLGHSVGVRLEVGHWLLVPLPVPGALGPTVVLGVTLMLPEALWVKVVTGLREAVTVLVMHLETEGEVE